MDNKFMGCIPGKDKAFIFFCIVEENFFPARGISCEKDAGKKIFSKNFLPKRLQIT